MSLNKIYIPSIVDILGHQTLTERFYQRNSLLIIYNIFMI